MCLEYKVYVPGFIMNKLNFPLRIVTEIIQHQLYEEYVYVYYF